MSNTVENERVEVIEKYAALADNLLAEEYGEDYEADDVVKLASFLIDHDIEAEEVMEKEAGTEETEETSLKNERVEVIEKYAALADNLLAEEYGEDYEADDVVKLAEYLIDYDVEAEEQIEKYAEYETAGRVMADAFMDQLSDEDTEDVEKTAEEDVEKTAELIVSTLYNEYFSE
jgi:hypothetical protein